MEKPRSWWLPYLEFAIFSLGTSLYYLLLLDLQALIFTYFHLFFSQAITICSSGCGATYSAIFLLPLKLGQSRNGQ